jgi:hexosaminidase
MIKHLLIFVVLAFSLNQSYSQEKFNLTPFPESIEALNGKLKIDKDFSIFIEGNPSDMVYFRADNFLRRLAGRTGIFIQQERIHPGFVQPEDHKMIIRVDEPGILELGVDESYYLTVEPDQVILHAVTSYGVVRGLETLLQWLDNDNSEYFFREVMIQDKPRFQWRGLLLDPARHWLPVDVIKRNIDGMTAVKMNVLHLHLTDDQGFRIESKVFPRLHELGGEGMYYTQEQMKDIIAYAAERGIRVVPEFDMPGHATSWLVGYPDLATVQKDYKIEREWGVMDPVMDPTKEETYEFLDAFLTEMAGLFPDDYIHIGGDENNGKHWNQSDHIQQFMKEKGITDNHELQAMFNQRIYDILTKNGKQMVGWDEIQHPEIPKNVVIQSWRGQEGLAAAAKAGYPVMLSNGYYIDLIQPASFHYLNDPLPEGIGLTAEQAKLVLGGEATMWGEQVTYETIDSRIWPRTAAIAERLWSPANIRDVDYLYNRLDNISIQLEELGLTHIKNYEMMLRRLCRGDGVEELKVLSDVCEPVKRYRRNALSDVNALSPYTRFVDACLPDASKARKFNNAVTSVIDNKNEADLVLVKEACDKWYANYQNLEVIIDENPVLQEIKPRAENLRVLGFIGLQAAKYFENGQSSPAAWRQYALDICEKAREPYGEAELMIIDGIKNLILATE